MVEPYYSDGQVSIYHGDCREVLPSLDGVGLVLTDPPFGVRSEAWDDYTPEEFRLFSMGWIHAARQLCDRLVTFSCSQTFGAMYDLCRMAYPEVRLVVWDKPLGSQYAGSADNGMWYAHENVLFCHQGVDRASLLEIGQTIRAAREAKGLSRGAVDMAIRGKKTGLCYRWEEGSCAPTLEQLLRLQIMLSLPDSFVASVAPYKPPRFRDVLSHRTETNAPHPCAKPVALMRDLIEIATEPGDLIVDPFMGGGSTLRAAKDLGRRAVGIEVSEEYCRAAVERLRQSVLPLTA